jgi:NAD(P)-dependent dehydrogenase (short-subunit alcohol dehydrogenase family)
MSRKRTRTDPPATGSAPLKAAAQPAAKAGRPRHIAITGAGSGIGRATALRLAAEGARLSLLGRDRDRLEAAADAARLSGAASVVSFACDIRDAAAVEAAFDAAASEHGDFDVLVANAGIGGANLPGAQDRFDDLIATNLGGTYRCLRAAQRRLAPGPRPRSLVVVASVLARFGVGGYTGYCASKAGLLGLVRALAMELAPQDVQVNAVCPGWVDTAMADAGFRAIAAQSNTDQATARANALSAVPLRRISRPEEVAGTIAWLLSPDARGMTGQAVDINNGAWMG